MKKSATSDARQSAGSTYLLDNAGKQAPARFAALSALFDSGTIRHLEDRGVAPGWHCLEVGGGSGSIAIWLADRVGATERVLVTDIDPRFLKATAEAALLADLKHYNLLRPALLELKKEWPKPA
ncbi:MAG TPA: class I SAM-dependent methyltransferase [Terriglobales bacterium]|nr:class I SAM-dependent methyltransferase [Terriglobales bacterium]